MSTHRKVKGYTRSTHKIEKVDYSEDYLLCLCGWEGRAYDVPITSVFYKKELDWPDHRRTAEPIGVTIGKYAPSFMVSHKDKVKISA